MKCEREIVLLLLRCCGMKDVLVFQNKSTVSDREIGMSPEQACS
jgi:hypothetical protein